MVEAGGYLYFMSFEGVEGLVDMVSLRGQVEEEFSLPTKVVEAEIDPKPFFDRGRKQYHSTMILKEMLSRLPPDAVRAVGLVTFDLFIPILTFVFGEAQLGGKVAIVSLARLRQEFYGLPPNPTLLQRRLIKEVKHELGHTFGLVHCSLRECVMSVANNVAAVDAKGMSFCQSCRELLQQNLRR